MTKRDQIAALASAGLSDYEIAARLVISKSRVRALIRAARAAGVDVPRAADRRAGDHDDGLLGAPGAIHGDPGDDAQEDDGACGRSSPR